LVVPSSSTSLHPGLGGDDGEHRRGALAGRTEKWQNQLGWSIKANLVFSLHRPAQYSFFPSCLHSTPPAQHEDDPGPFRCALLRRLPGFGRQRSSQCVPPQPPTLTLRIYGEWLTLIPAYVYVYVYMYMYMCVKYIAKGVAKLSTTSFGKDLNISGYVTFTLSADGNVPPPRFLVHFILIFILINDLRRSPWRRISRANWAARPTPCTSTRFVFYSIHSTRT
jgi:hypothetical protein